MAGQTTPLKLMTTNRLTVAADMPKYFAAEHVSTLGRHVKCPGKANR
jgi:hypothetical protein